MSNHRITSGRAKRLAADFAAIAVTMLAVLLAMFGALVIAGHLFGWAWPRCAA